MRAGPVAELPQSTPPEPGDKHGLSPVAAAPAPTPTGHRAVSQNTLGVWAVAPGAQEKPGCPRGGPVPAPLRSLWPAHGVRAAFRASSMGTSPQELSRCGFLQGPLSSPAASSTGPESVGPCPSWGPPGPLGKPGLWTEVTTPPLPEDRAFGLGGVTQSEQTPGKTHTLPRGPHHVAEMP